MSKEPIMTILCRTSVFTTRTLDSSPSIGTNYSVKDFSYSKGNPVPLTVLNLINIEQLTDSNAFWMSSFNDTLFYII